MKIDESKKWLSKLEITDNKIEYVLLKSHLFKVQRRNKDALSVLLENSMDSSELWLEIGLLYWELEQYDKALMPFLKVT